MRYSILLLIVILSIFSAQLKAAAPLVLSVDESISDNAYLRILKSDSEQITFAIRIDSEAINQSDIGALVLYFTEKGIPYQLDSSKEKITIILNFSSEDLPSQLEYLSGYVTENFNKASYIDLLLHGKLNQQKTLGKIHSRWGKLKNSYKLEQQYDFSYQLEPDLNKNKSSYWAKVFALLLSCDSQRPLFSDFILTHDKYYCNNSSNLSLNMTAGEIANIKADTYQWLQLNKNNPQKISTLIQKFRQEKSIGELNDFADFLPELSIEEISSYYHEINADKNLQVQDTEPFDISFNKLDSDKRNYIELISNESDSWTLSIFIPNQIPICKIINCVAVESRLNFYSLSADSSWLAIEFPKHSPEKDFSFIIEEVIKPLNITKSLKNAKFYIIGPDNIEQISPLINAANFIQNNNWSPQVKKEPKLFIENKHSQLCVEQQFVASSSWIFQIVSQYYWQYLEVKHSKNFDSTAWQLFRNTCFNQSDIDLELFIKDEETFELIKAALINQIKAIDSKNGFYMSLSMHYQFDIQEYLISALEQIDFQEYQYVTSNYALTRKSLK